MLVLGKQELGEGGWGTVLKAVSGDGMKIGGSYRQILAYKSDTKQTPNIAFWLKPSLMSA